MKLSTIAFLLTSLLAFLLGLFALENVAAGLEQHESTTAIAAFDFFQHDVYAWNGGRLRRYGTNDQRSFVQLMSKKKRRRSLQTFFGLLNFRDNYQERIHIGASEPPNSICEEGFQHMLTLHFISRLMPFPVSGPYRALATEAHDRT
ncbi:hypothetical protein DER46DRAFT_578859 [Fusarium sp. MPI-SDFR-AT-0072]|nr:hypothetical protein DER46DRAFT_578859 [Fusarium sp. MPI-SDFR-AT-0072]